jgi:hypothetical protein
MGTCCCTRKHSIDEKVYQHYILRVRKQSFKPFNQKIIKTFGSLEIDGTKFRAKKPKENVEKPIC